MIEQMDVSEGALLGIRIQKDVTDRETHDLIDLISNRFQDHGPVRLLLDYDTDPDMISAEDLYENMRFAKLASDKLARMAVIGTHDLQNTWVGLFGLFGGIETRFFLSSDRNAALEWLNA